MSGRMNRGSQASIRLSDDLKKKIEEASIEEGLPLTEWIRRACEEKLSRAKNPDAQRIKRLEEDVDMLKRFLIASSAEETGAEDGTE